MDTSDDQGYLSLERLTGVLRRRWWIVVLLTLVAGGAAFLFSKSQQKQYTATASILFENQQTDEQATASGLPDTAPVQASAQVMATNISLLTQQSSVAERTAAIVGHGLTAGAVTRAISASEQGQTNLADISATYTSPSVAASIANTFVSQFIASQRSQQQASVQLGLKLVERQVAALSAQQTAGTDGQALLDREESLRILAQLQDGGAQIVGHAVVPDSPSSPKVTRNTALGLLLGLLLGLGMALLLERLDRRMTNVDELAATYRLPLLAVVPLSKTYALSPRRAPERNRGDTEVFKLLRAYLRYFNVDRELRVLLVASAAPGDGKTTVAHNLAEAAQETGTKALLIEADLRRPGLARLYELSDDAGMSDVLIGRLHVREAIQSVPVATRVNGSRQQMMLDVLVAGHPPPNPAELLQSHAMDELLSWAAKEYELVIVDTPPLAVVSDAMPLLRKVDGVVLVSQLGKNTKDAAAFLRNRLVGVNAPLLGVVANGVRGKGKSGYGYGYGYYGADEASGGALRLEKTDSDAPDNPQREQLEMSRRSQGSAE